MASIAGRGVRGEGCEERKALLIKGLRGKLSGGYLHFVSN